jgi:hypothetical protein
MLRPAADSHGAKSGGSSERASYRRSLLLAMRPLHIFCLCMRLSDEPKAILPPKGVPRTLSELHVKPARPVARSGALSTLFMISSIGAGCVSKAILC